MFGLRMSSVCALVSAILVASLSASLVAAANTINVRPISDWTSVRNQPSGNFTGPFDDPDSYFIAFYRFLGAPAEGVDMSTVQLDGTIIERRRPTGDVEVTVRLDVRNAPLTIYRLADVLAFTGGPLPTPVLGAGADGSIDYIWEFRVVTDDFGVRLVPANFREALRLMIAGNGTGHFTDYAANFGFTPGAVGQVHVLQTGLFAVAAHSNGQALEDLFPGELLSLHETGR